VRDRKTKKRKSRKKTFEVNKTVKPITCELERERLDNNLDLDRDNYLVNWPLTEWKRDEEKHVLKDNAKFIKNFSKQKFNNVEKERKESIKDGDNKHQNPIRLFEIVD
jgi:hypothetical protein